MKSLRNRFVDAPDSVGARARQRRWNTFMSIFPDLTDMTVIDLGGTAEYWKRAPIRPKHVHIVNLDPVPDDLPDWARGDTADACELPESILSGSYDLVISNSVIEHVGGHVRRLQFADAVHRLADRHWIQCPYRYFPVEPHVLFPGFQFLPVAARARIVKKWPLVHTNPADRAGALRDAMGVELLSLTEMRYYFPDSKLHFDRMAGLVKSVIAVKNR
ncbi:hypothetical protein [Rhizohabitans arisaemae]|uniref:hypothetical protein n=1 Tax=Rhizohabitans arisaemae TaxID=2720610 RepID=UPI0024B11A09|nr:hypothetical protein [Rhizohabitans arisaemae]